MVWLWGKNDPDVALAELQAVFTALVGDGVILVDDCGFTCRGEQSGYQGTGSKVVPWVLANGWEIVQQGSQCVLKRALIG